MDARKQQIIDDLYVVAKDAAARPRQRFDDDFVLTVAFRPFDTEADRAFARAWFGPSPVKSDGEGDGA